MVQGIYFNPKIAGLIFQYLHVQVRRILPAYAKALNGTNT